MNTFFVLERGAVLCSPLALRLANKLFLRTGLLSLGQHKELGMVVIWKQPTLTSYKVVTAV